MIRVNKKYKYVGRMGLAYYNTDVLIVTTDREKRVSDIKFRDGNVLTSVPDVHLKESK